MRRFIALTGGILTGGAIGTIAALLFAPISGESMRDGIRQRWSDALAAGQQAAQAHRAELNQRLVEMTGPHPEDSPILALVEGNAANGKGQSS